MSEVQQEQPVPGSYADIVNNLAGIVDSCTTWEVTDEWDGGYEETGSLSFDGSIRPFFLPEEVTKELGLGSLVRARVIGSVEEGMGIAVIVRPVNPFNKNIQGFYIQPTESSTDGPSIYDPGRGFEVWQGSAQWPKRKGAYWGKELINDDAHLADPEVAHILAETIQKHAQFKQA